VASLLFLYAGHFTLDLMNFNLESLLSESAAVAAFIHLIKILIHRESLCFENETRSARHVKKYCFYSLSFVKRRGFRTKQNPSKRDSPPVSELYFKVLPNIYSLFLIKHLFVILQLNSIKQLART